jgi:hypothetical protein
MFTCPACDKASWNPHDAANGYCGACKWYTAVPGLAVLRPELFTEHGKPAPTFPEV